MFSVKSELFIIKQITGKNDNNDVGEFLQYGQY